MLVTVTDHASRYLLLCEVRDSNKEETAFTAFGRICIYRKKINLTQSLAGQSVGIKEVDDGIWLVSFMQYDLGYIDLEEKTLQPLANPFGAKV